MKYLKIVVFAILYSCTGNQKLVRIHFRHVVSNPNKLVINNYTMNLPQGFQLHRYNAGGETGGSDEYLYKDSSIIYITDFENSLNYNNIQSSGLGSKVFEYKTRTNKTPTDTLILTGISKNNLFWKEILIGDVQIGYLNVNNLNKVIYDNSLTTFKKK